MYTPELVKDLLTLETLELARDRAEELLATSSQTVSAAMNQAVTELREYRPDIDLSELQVPDLRVNRNRTGLIVAVVLALLAIVVWRKRSSGDTTPSEPATTA